MMVLSICIRQIKIAMKKFRLVLLVLFFVSTFAQTGTILPSNTPSILNLYLNPCALVNSNGVCITSTNTNSQGGSATINQNAGSSAPTLIASNQNTLVTGSTTNTQTSTGSSNNLSLTPGTPFIPFGIIQQIPSATTTQTITLTNTATLTSPTSSSSSTTNPSTQSTSSTQNNAKSILISTGPTPTIPFVVQNPVTQTPDTQTSSIIIPTSNTLNQQFITVLFNQQNGNTLSSTSSTTANQASQMSSQSTASSTKINSSSQSSTIPFVVSVSDSNTSSSSSSSSSSALASSSSSSASNSIYKTGYCKKYNITTQECIQCAQGSRINPKYNKTDPSSNNFCLALDPLCKTYALDFSCQTCYKGYYQLMGICVKSTLGEDVFCKTVGSDNICSQCYNGYYSDLVLKSCKRSNTRCKTLKSFYSNQCASCYGGYFVVNGDCVVISAASSNKTNNTNNVQNAPTMFYYQGVPILVTTSSPTLTDDSYKQNCASISNDTCLKCIERAYFKNGVCVAVSDFCKTFDISTGACTSCYLGYRLVSGNCQLQ